MITLTKPSGTTFQVAELKPPEGPLPESTYENVITERVVGESDFKALEAFSRDTKPLVSLYGGKNAFVEALNRAYDDHRPFVMSPDMVWLLLTQGFAKHVTMNAESLRSKFVSFEGKTKIEVRRDDFTRGFASNPWEEVFGEFSEAIKGHIGDDNHGVVVKRFSTTGIVEQAAMEVTLMDAMQQYFDYEFSTCCGVPAYTLEGTTDDWKLLRDSAKDFTGYGLDWWTRELIPVLDHFARASDGDVDTRWWNGFYKEGGGSGGPFISGHAVKLFPYLGKPGKYERNRLVGEAPRHWADGLKPGDFASGLSVAPFVWNYFTSKFDMDFVAGFVGASQDRDTLAIRPEIGWAVRDRPASDELSAG
jgi:hypothetical protein